jgi:hypothetical protein
MYGNYNPYYNPQTSQQNYQQELMNIRDRIDKQLQQAQIPNTQQTPTNLTQNFQLAPNNTGIKYVNDIEDVKKELVFTDTLFPNKEYTLLYVKNAKGEIKTFELREIVEKDQKDVLIDELRAKIDMLEKEKINSESGTNDFKNDDGKITGKKSTSISTNK